jgi:hypothetical protein
MPDSWPYRAADPSGPSRGLLGLERQLIRRRQFLAGSRQKGPMRSLGSNVMPPPALPTRGGTERVSRSPAGAYTGGHETHRIMADTHAGFEQEVHNLPR